jgi:uncharacterized protein YjbI with pentapeptide repeats
MSRNSDSKDLSSQQTTSNPTVDNFSAAAPNLEPTTPNSQVKTHETTFEELPADAMGIVMKSLTKENGYLDNEQLIKLLVVNKGVHNLVKISAEAIDFSQKKEPSDTNRRNFLLSIFKFSNIKRIKLPKWINDTDLQFICDHIARHNQANQANQAKQIHITDLDLSGTEITTLPNNLPTTLKRISLAGCTQLTNLTLTPEQCQKLTHLNLSGCDQLSSQNIQDIISRSPNLKDLNLSGCLQIKTLPDNLPTTLKRISLDNCLNLQPQELRKISSTQLEEFNIGGCNRLDRTDIQNVISRSPNLKDLNLAWCTQLTNLTLTPEQCQNLTHLNLSGRNHQLQNIQTIVFGCQKLTHLNLYGCDALGIEDIKKIILDFETFNKTNNNNPTKTNFRRVKLSREQILQIIKSTPEDEIPNFYGVDLSGVNLNEINFIGADLTGANLKGAHLTRTNFASANLTGANLEWANLEWANLTGANLRGADLTGADLTRANLTGVYLTGVYLTRADLTGANLTGANLTGVYLTRANLAGANLRGADLTGADFTGVNLIKVKLSREQIEQIIVSTPDGKHPNFCGVDFSGVDLSRIDFKGAKLKGVDLTGVNLKRVNLTNADLRGAYLTGADLTDANLTGVYLIMADLTGANLTGANLTGVYLTRANLEEAKLEGANLTGVDLTGANLKFAFIDDTTTNLTNTTVDAKAVASYFTEPATDLNKITDRLLFKLLNCTGSWQEVSKNTLLSFTPSQESQSSSTPTQSTSTAQFTSTTPSTSLSTQGVESQQLSTKPAVSLLDQYVIAEIEQDGKKYYYFIEKSKARDIEGDFKFYQFQPQVQQSRTIE